jgi:hypothetical protein
LRFLLAGLLSKSFQSGIGRDRFALIEAGVALGGQSHLLGISPLQENELRAFGPTERDSVTDRRITGSFCACASATRRARGCWLLHDFFVDNLFLVVGTIKSVLDVIFTR